jgi:UDP-N-acetylmuramate--alanine ligase
MLGIGGVGMAGLALLLKEKGWQVSGCDAYPGPLLTWLNDLGISAVVGHDPDHLSSALMFLVRSPAVPWSEPELQTAMAAGIPVIDRGRLLPELLKSRPTIAVAGTHGKTTTASMIAWCLAASGRPHSYCIGGVCPGLGSVARVDTEGWTVVEADESDGTLRYYVPDIAVITSMDLDHVDYYNEPSRLNDVFGTFAGQAQKLIVPENEAMAFQTRTGGVVSFGFGEKAAWRAVDVVMTANGSQFDVMVEGAHQGTVCLSVPGRHNIANALAAMAAGQWVGLTMVEMIAALAAFQLPRRRYELVASGQGIQVISDYAHHPVEISALLDQARLSNPKRIVAVFQPHRYSRTKAFRESFAEVLSKMDEVILVPVYAASEPFIEGGTSNELYASCHHRGFRKVQKSTSVRHAWELLRQVWRAGDLVLIIGAGDVDQIGTWAAEMLGLTITNNRGNEV